MPRSPMPSMSFGNFRRRHRSIRRDSAGSQGVPAILGDPDGAALRPGLGMTSGSSAASWASTATIFRVRLFHLGVPENGCFGRSGERRWGMVRRWAVVRGAVVRGAVAGGCLLAGTVAAPFSVWAQQAQSGTIVLTPGDIESGTGGGCAVSVDVGHRGSGELERLALAFQALDASGAILESAGLRLERLPAVGGAVPQGRLHFSPSACAALSTILVTVATCSLDGDRDRDCLDRIRIAGEPRDPEFRIAAE